MAGHGHKPGVQFCFWCRQRWTPGSVLLLKTLYAAVFWKCGTVAFPNVNVNFFDEKLFSYWLASIRHIVANYNINWWRKIFWYSVWNIDNISRWFYWIPTNMWYLNRNKPLFLVRWWLLVSVTLKKKSSGQGVRMHANQSNHEFSCIPSPWNGALANPKRQKEHWKWSTVNIFFGWLLIQKLFRYLVINTTLPEFFKVTFVACVIVDVNRVFGSLSLLACIRSWYTLLCTILVCLLA